MPDLAAISTVLSSIKTATDIAKFIRESDTSLEKAEFKLKLADLVSALADAKMEAVDVQDVLADRDRRIKELEDALETKGRSFVTTMATMWPALLANRPADRIA